MTLVIYRMRVSLRRELGQGPPRASDTSLTLLGTMILKVSVVNVGDMIHPPVASEGHRKDVLQRWLCEKCYECCIV